MTEIEQAFANTMRGLSPKPPLVVGVSGGMDSMALMELLLGAGYKPIVAHFNHQLRGAESDGDEAFVQAEAARHGLEFRAGRGDVRAHAKGISIEMAARDLRHEFLAKTAAEFGGTILLAHHADDQLELYVMREIRGIAGYGLAGMRPVTRSPADESVTIIRPLLGFRRSTIKQFIEARHIAFREDSSNTLFDADRNRIRHVTLPEYRAKFGPDWDERTLGIIPALQKAEHERRVFAKAWVGGDFVKLELGLKVAVVIMQLERADIPITAGRVAKLLANPGRPLMISPGKTVALGSNGRLVFPEAPTLAQPMNVDLDALNSRPICFAGACFEWDWQLALKKPWPEGEDVMVFDSTRVGSRIILRHPQPGDRVRLSGRGSARPLMDVLGRNKIPRERRSSVVVATTDSGEIFWVEGLRIIEDFKVTPNSIDMLVWRWRRE
jgi:tRNA(Ile)-lysidine synthase